MELIVQIGFPIDMGEFGLDFLGIQNMFSFIIDYFSYWPSAICIVIVQFAQVPARVFLYGKELDTSFVWIQLLHQVYTMFNLYVIHIIMTWVGLIFVKSETVRIGNEQVLENFKEGVIMIESETKTVLFANESAKKFEIKLGRLDDSMRSIQLKGKKPNEQ